MQTIISIVHVLVAVALIGLVLIQHGRGADAGAAFGSGASGTLFGSRGPASFMTRLTTALAAIFFATSLSLAFISGQSVDRRSIVERIEAPESSEVPVPLPGDVPAAPQGAAGTQGDVPAAPGVPATGGDGSAQDKQQ